jgi:hypothetical protein
MVDRSIAAVGFSIFGASDYGCGIVGIDSRELKSEFFGRFFKKGMIFLRSRKKIAKIPV